MIIAGASAYCRDMDFARFRQIADSVGALLLGDISHPAGLIAKGLMNDPIPHCHIVTTTTHKTLRGPRGGMIMMGKDLEIEVMGDTKMYAHGNMTVDVRGNFLQKVSGTYTLSSEGNMVIMAPRIDLNPEGENASNVQTLMDKVRGLVNGLIQKLSPTDLQIRNKD